MRSLAAHILRKLGYNVLEAEDAGQAREVVQSHNKGRIDLLLADVVLPNSELRRQGTRPTGSEDLHEETKVLFTSGYVEESVFNAPRAGARHGIFAENLLPRLILRGEVRRGDLRADPWRFFRS